MGALHKPEKDPMCNWVCCKTAEKGQPDKTTVCFWSRTTLWGKRKEQCMKPTGQATKIGHTTRMNIIPPVPNLQNYCQGVSSVEVGFVSEDNLIFVWSSKNCVQSCPRSYLTNLETFVQIICGLFDRLSCKNTLTLSCKSWSSWQTATLCL